MDAYTGTSEWTPARIFLAASAVFHIPIAILGFMQDHSFPTTSAAASAHHGMLFGVLMTNGWHNLAALGIGLISAYFVCRPHHAREVALAVGVGHVGVVVAFSLWTPSTFLFASNGADQVIHSTTAILGIGSALLTGRHSPVVASSAA